MARDNLSRDVEGHDGHGSLLKRQIILMVGALTFGETFCCQSVDDDDQVLMHASRLRQSFPCLSLKSSVLNYRHGPADRLGSHRWQFDH